MGVVSKVGGDIEMDQNGNGNSYLGTAGGGEVSLDCFDGDEVGG